MSEQNETRVQVTYYVPVAVTVNVAERQVECVRVVAEGIYPDETSEAHSEETWDVLSDDVAARAYEIAENEEWPTWD